MLHREQDRKYYPTGIAGPVEAHVRKLKKYRCMLIRNVQSARIIYIHTKHAGLGHAS